MAKRGGAREFLSLGREVFDPVTKRTVRRARRGKGGAVTTWREAKLSRLFRWFD